MPAVRARVLQSRRRSTTAEAGVAVGARVVVPMRRGALGPLSETLTLVMVGGLLLGLAAAVRRTT